MCFALHNGVRLTEYSWLKISITSYTVRSWRVDKRVVERQWLPSIAFRQTAWDRPRQRRTLQPKSENWRNCNCTAVADSYSPVFLPLIDEKSCQSMWFIADACRYPAVQAKHMPTDAPVPGSNSSTDIEGDQTCKKQHQTKRINKYLKNVLRCRV